MNTTLISKEGFSNLKAVSDWVNDLVGKTSPDNSNFKIIKINQFQLVEKEGAYGVIVLVETEKRQSMSSMVMSMRKDLDLMDKDS